jgi:hypothetical protein
MLASRRGAIAGALAVGLALGLSILGVAGAERTKPDAAKTFNCNNNSACLQGINAKGGAYGVIGKAPAGAGVFGEVYSSNFQSYVSSGIQGDDYTGLSYDNGVYGYSDQGNALHGEVGSSAISGIAVNGITDSATGYLFSGTGNFSGGGFTDIDGYGTVVTTGLIYTAGSCHNGCLKTKDVDRRAVSYTPRESLPSMEDTGEARLVDGHAYVRIDAALANVIDSGAEFSVFITPEGDNRGLYVTQKSSVGFAVRESQSGRSTLAFAYRIVAKPYADVSSRLPMRSFTVRTIRSPHRD